MRRLATSIVTAAMVWLAGITPLCAHNQSVHQVMTDLAWQMMVFVNHPGLGRLASGDAEWDDFLRRVAAAPAKYRLRPSQLEELSAPKWSDCPLEPKSWNTMLVDVPYPPAWDFKGNGGCGVIKDWKPSLDGGKSKEFVGAALGLWAATPDDAYDDTHLWYRPTNAAGLGTIRNIVNEAAGDSLTVLLVPVVCAIKYIFGDGDDCVKDATKIGDSVDVGEEIEGWLPAIGDDISDGDYVGIWHFIDVRPGASNEFDSSQGKLFDEAGVPGKPMDPVEVVLMAYFDVSGLSVNYDKSHGVANYTADTADDGVSATIRRDKGQWQSTSIAHVAFEPVSNLAYYGWTHFRDDPGHPIRMLAWPLHAMGDATVPMHVTGTSAWGHRPFEDSQEQLWSKVWNFQPGQTFAQQAAVTRVMRRAFEWWKLIKAWRAAHGGSQDIPIRQIITGLAIRTYDYSMAEYQSTGGAWPFSATASTKYLLYPHATADDYAAIPGAADLVRPLYEDSMGAAIALLVAASDYFPQ